MAPKKKNKTTTENKTLSDIWGDFEMSYKPFINWTLDPKTQDKFAIIDFIADEPVEYTNKWDRKQWKILVKNEYDEEAFLSGGKRLFQTILRFCKKYDCLPTELPPHLTLWRIGSGFDTKYKIEE